MIIRSTFIFLFVVVANVSFLGAFDGFVASCCTLLENVLSVLSLRLPKVCMITLS